MNRKKAEKLIRRKIARAKPCPFCGKIPEILAYCDTEFSNWGSWGHYVYRKPCCRPTFTGQTDLFFTNNWRKPNYSLWWYMVCRVVDEWNTRLGENNLHQKEFEMKDNNQIWKDWLSVKSTALDYQKNFMNGLPQPPFKWSEKQAEVADRIVKHNIEFREEIESNIDVL